MRASAVSTVIGLLACGLFWLLGEALVRAVGLSYGGGLAGFVLFFLALRFRVINLSRVDRGARVLVDHLAFPLVGVTASVVFEWRALAESGIAVIAAASVATLGVLLFVGLGATALFRQGGRS